MKAFSIIFLLSFISILHGKPNIIIINVDDLGWNDATYLPEKKARYFTPNITKLAKGGMIFTNGYAASPVCSPTRASLLTGKTPANLKITTHIMGSNKKHIKPLDPLPLNQLPLEEITFAEIFKKHNYTTGFIGKWHLAGRKSKVYTKKAGFIAPLFHPEKQGFDINVAGCAYGQPPSYFAPYNIKNLEDGKNGEYLTDRLAQESVNFIKNNKDKPFLLYLNPYSVHTPIEVADERVQLIKDKVANKKNLKYAGMIYSVDLMLGRVLQTLEELNLKDTLIIFTSDNGGLFGNPPLHGRKGELYEGGIRVPFIAYWPNKIKAGVNHTPVISYDIFPTIVDVIKANKDLPKGIEGESLFPILTQEKESVKRKSPLVWHFPHVRKNCLSMGSAIRIGKWKYIYIFGKKKKFLFNLEDDLAEKKNLARTMKDKTEEMHKALFDYLKSVEATMPKGYKF